MPLPIGTRVFSQDAVAVSKYPLRERREQSLRAYLAIETFSRGASFAVVVHLSRVPIISRQPSLRRFAIGLLNGISVRRDARLFTLARGDVALVCPEMPVDEVDTVLKRIGDMFGIGRAALTGDGREALFSWFDLSRPQDVSALEQCASEAETAVEEGNATVRRPITARDVSIIAKTLETQPVAPFIQSQRAVSLAGAQVGTLFCETFLSIGELQRVVAPDIDLFAKPALFHFISRILDRCMLRSLAASGPQSVKPISLNLNIGTLFTPEFRRFDQVWHGAARPVIEIQIVDALTDTEGFAIARDDLKARGYLVLLDGLTPLHLAAIDVGGLQTDLIKVAWSRPQIEALRLRDPDLLRRRIEKVGRDRIVLGRVETEEAIATAVGFGVTRFQGYYIDRLMQAIAAKRRL
ncbi:conserved hypothetical protein [Candidatus Defluviicoccus seviourii]|uniref:EAL domain-containing protein n=1 Tax=Candidatus Defluviicoccus seviourii TaxID=2565273 RepID=A0A564WFZ1_9PROT|nr:conserved hypothetical protein [Candidatus Defluviicoccus seviourii]